MGEDNYDDISIEYFKWVVCGSVPVNSHFDHSRSTALESTINMRYDVERGAGRHHGASFERYSASSQQYLGKFSLHGPDRDLTDPETNISRFLESRDGGFLIVCFYFWDGLAGPADSHDHLLYFVPVLFLFGLLAHTQDSGTDMRRLSTPRPLEYIPNSPPC